MDRINRLLRELEQETSRSVDRFRTPGGFYHHSVNYEASGGDSGKPLPFPEYPPQTPEMSRISHVLIDSDLGRDKSRGAYLQQCG